MFNVLFTSQYRKCYKLLIRRGYDMSKLDNTIVLLMGGELLPPKYRDHPLKGNFKGQRECHVDGLPD